VIEISRSPADQITRAEAAKIIISYLGYAPLAEMQGSYPKGYIEQAKGLGILENVLTYGIPINAEGLNKILLKALTCPLQYIKGFIL